MKTPLISSLALAAIAGNQPGQNRSVTVDGPTKALQHGSILTDGSYAEVGLTNIKAANFELDGSVAIDTLNFTIVPEPSTSILGGFAALALLRRRR